MIKYFKEALKATNENIIIATPFVLFMLLFSLYLNVMKYSAKTPPAFAISVITIFLMIGAFLAGWFYMIKKSIEISDKEFIMDEDRAKASLGLIKDFAVGIGEYFFSFLGYCVVFCAIVVSIFAVAYYLGMKFIGAFGVPIQDYLDAMMSSQALKEMIGTMTVEQMIKMNQWNLLAFVASCFVYFSTLLYAPQIIFSEKNPIKAFGASIVNLFRKFWKNLALYVFITFLCAGISILSAFTIKFPLIYFIISVFYFYSLVYVVVLIFLYYDREFIQKKGDSNCGTDGGGENLLCDSTGEEE